MNDDPNKEIRAAVDYALEKGWRLLKAAAGTGTFGEPCCARTRIVPAAGERYIARQGVHKTMRVAYASLSITVHINGPLWSLILPI